MITEVLTDAKTIEFAFPASTAMEPNSLLFNNAGVAALASAQVDQASEAANQLLFASKFLGVAKDKRLAGEGAGTRVVTVDGVFDMTCPSTTWAVGDLIGASENGDGDALEDLQVEKVTDPAKAIGRCVKAATSATTVRGRLISRVLPPGPATNVFTATYNFTGTPAATDLVFFVAPFPCRVVGISEVHSVAAGGTSELQVTKDSTTAAPGAGTVLLATPFNLNATANTVQVGALSATPANLLLAAGDRLAVDFGHAIQSSAGVVVTVALEPIVS